MNFDAFTNLDLVLRLYEIRLGVHILFGGSISLPTKGGYYLPTNKHLDFFVNILSQIAPRNILSQVVEKDKEDFFY